MLREIFLQLPDFLTRLAELLDPGGARAVVAENLLLKHQLLVLNRSRSRGLNLKAGNRILVGLCYQFVRPGCLPKQDIILKPDTLLAFHQALKARKYRRLFSAHRRVKPGPHGPSKELIQAIVEMNLLL